MKTSRNRTPRIQREDAGDDRALSRKRARQAMWACVLTFCALTGLFARYQLIGAFQSDRFVEPAFLQRYRGVPVTLSRGNIVDRYGVPLHYPVWDSAIARFPTDGSGTGDGSAKVVRSPSESQVVEVLGGGAERGFSVIPEEVRYGPGSIARHVVGHIRPNAYMNSADNVGESGLEKWFQSSLAGGYPASAGVMLTGEGDGLPGVGVRITPPHDLPKDLRTTIDASVQRIVEEALDRHGVERGAAVVLDVSTAEILAMASRPQFDQNHPERSLNDPDAPFVNRAISAFAPGSVWKPVVIALALERGYVREGDTFACTGKYEIGDRSVSCGSKEGGHGQVTVKEAVALSCNSALIQVALRIPSRELVEFAKEAWMGRKTGIQLPNEAAGVLPDAWDMYAGDIANFAIGQGYLSVTPLQVACFFRAIAAGGEWKNPVLIPGSEQVTRDLFSRSTAAVLADALLLGTRQGTGKAAYVPVYGSAGKTGTAETGVEGGRPHAWFCGWAPVIAPKYVVVVFVEEGGDGPTVAGPIFRDISEGILRK